MDFQNIIKARQAITDKHGTKKPQLTFGGEMPCPICDKGTLGYQISAVNGHINASCETEECVHWME
ncbi:hypothetical protein [Acinetobacter tandoii]|uniref:Uncharacterized protein n=1 Tax=Acinetobacter tandoii DSM 14970 = CIP 107469 TaxID=1120927 RepID=R9AYI9_9GAMM|nr:hypothetical protein [Acinetobacter tandoii]EOR07242.1 hypothetical protein I593_02129 [Acinetobacter tandoii DSM 14970 = CIP 107469]